MQSYSSSNPFYSFSLALLLLLSTSSMALQRSTTRLIPFNNLTKGFHSHTLIRRELQYSHSSASILFAVNSNPLSCNLRTASASHKPLWWSHRLHSSALFSTKTSSANPQSPSVPWESFVEKLSSPDLPSRLLSGEEDGEMVALSQQLLTFFLQRGKVPRHFLEALLDASIARYSQLPNVVEVNSSAPKTGGSGNVVVCGDTHGQFDDFSHIFTEDVSGFPNKQNRYIFNGDVVDRGPMAVEILIVMLTMKLASDRSMLLLRGNHETTAMNKYFGFEKEVLRKYDTKILSKFRTLFQQLPIAAIVDRQAFVVHGGLGKKTANMTIADINALDRKLEADDLQELSELLWSDPKEGLQGFRFNSARGGGEQFGADVTHHFLKANKLELLIRSHEVRMDGFDVMHGGRLITVFSAPNYCGSVGNLGAVLKFEGTKLPSNNTNETNSEQGKIVAIQFQSKATLMKKHAGFEQ